MDVWLRRQQWKIGKVQQTASTPQRRRTSSGRLHLHAVHDGQGVLSERQLSKGGGRSAAHVLAPVARQNLCLGISKALLRVQTLKLKTTNRRRTRWRLVTCRSQWRSHMQRHFGHKQQERKLPARMWPHRKPWPTIGAGFEGASQPVRVAGGSARDSLYSTDREGCQRNIREVGSFHTVHAAHTLGGIRNAADYSSIYMNTNKFLARRN